MWHFPLAVTLFSSYVDTECFGLGGEHYKKKYTVCMYENFKELTKIFFKVLDFEALKDA